MSENNHKRKTAVNEEDRSYAFLFLLSGIVLAGVSVWVFYNEVVTLRPWKAFQKQFNELEYRKLQAEYDKALLEMDSPEKGVVYQVAKERLEKAQEVFNRPEIQKEYRGLQADMNRLKKELKPLRFELMDIQNKRMEEDYLYTKYGREENKRKLEALQKKGAEISGRINEINVQLEQVSDKITLITRDIDKYTAEMESFTVNSARLKTAMVAVRRKRPALDDKQVYIEETNEADRCMACHVGINKEENLSGRQPFAKHPGDYIYIKNHPANQFGCVSCHRGQGRATSSVEEAHGEVEFWLTPLLRGQQVQASCIKCHGNADDLKGGRSLAKGIEIFRDRGCSGCHKAKGFADEKIGPDLNKVGEKVNFHWLTKWLKNPRDYLPKARMPDFKLSDGEIKAVADFLTSLSTGQRNLISAQQVEPDDRLAEKGKVRFNQHRCVICHPVDGKGGDVYSVYAPDLAKVAGKVNRKWLTGFLKNPKSHNPSTAMPRFRFEGNDAIEEIVEFISYEYVDWDFLEQEEEGNIPGVYVELDPELIKEGESLIRKYGCFGCHEIKGFGEMGKVGAELTGFGNKPVDLLDFGRVEDIPHTLEGWITTKLETPRIFRDVLKMPEFGFSPEEIKCLAMLLEGFTEDEVHEKFKVPDKVSSYKPQGEFGKIVRDVNCLVCHEINGRGGKYAPVLSYEGSRVNRGWLEAFLSSPDLIRPMLQQMPKFGFSSGEVQAIADYLQTALVNDELLTEKLPANATWDLHPDTGAKGHDDKSGLPAGREMDIDEGKNIYYRNGCQACHQIGDSGGAVGPNLGNTGSRLTAGYIFNHIKHPGKWGFLPIAPDYGLSDKEAGMITCYLSTLAD